MTDVIVGLDIGTSNIRVAIGEIVESERDENKLNVQIVGMAKRPSAGVRNGTVINIEAAIGAIKDAVEAAEQDAGIEVFNCVTGIGGSQIESFNSQGLAGIANKNHTSREITQQDKKVALDSACATLIPLDRDFLHTIPRDYTVDGVSGIKDPIDMLGVRLEADVHIITASKTSIKNLTTCVNRAGYDLDKVWSKTLAQIRPVVHNDELEMGSILIDLGAGTTDVLVLNGGASVCSLSIPVGGNLVTNDISLEKGVPFAVAEKIKLEAGCCYAPALETNDEIAIPGVGGRPPEMITQIDLCDIIQPRVEEIFSMVRSEIVHKTDLLRLDGNIILTGGGALMPGVVELAQMVFGTSAVRIGKLENLDGLEQKYRGPEFATVIGLIQSQVAQYESAGQSDKTARKQGSGTGKRENFIKKIIDKLF